MPSPGICVRSIPKSRERCSTSLSSSKNEPGSRRSSTRSRAVSFPSACCRATRSGPPPSRLFARRASRSARRLSIVMRASENDPPLFGELSPDTAEQLLTVDPSRGDLVPRRLHHPASFLVERPLLLRLAGECRQDRLSKRARGLLLEELSGHEAARRA